MKYVKGECFSRTFYTSAVVLFFEDTKDEIEIDCTIEEYSDENADFQINEIVVANPEMIPEGYTEQDIIDFVKENFEA